MGQRANLIILQNDKYELYYNHWCANTLPHEMFWGEQYAVPYIRMQKRVDDSDWLDDVWAEGGVVVDLDRKCLLLYGGEDILYDIPLRNLFLRLMTALWQGWKIKWAFEGIAEMADYVGYTREKVIAARKEERANCTFYPPDEKKWMDLIASVAFASNQVRLFPLEGQVEPYLLAGSDVIDPVNHSSGYETFNIGEWTKRFPCGGFHIDIVNRRFSYWDAYIRVHSNQTIQSRWPGWEIVNLNSDYEAHAAATGGRLHFYVAKEQHLIDEIRALLLSESSYPLESVEAVVKSMEDQGKRVEVNTNVMQFSSFELPLTVKEELLAYAISRI